MKPITWAAIFMIGLILVGIYTDRTEDGQRAAMAENVIRISPSQVFKGDVKKLEPHLGMMTGAVKVEYAGPKRHLKLSYEIWEKGKRQDQSGSMTSVIDSPYEGEVSVSMKQVNVGNSNPKFEGTIVISDENGYSASSFAIDKYDSDVGHGPVQWQEAKIVEDNQEVAVWGLVAANAYSTAETIEQQAQAADWAFVLKVSMEDKP